MKRSAKSLGYAIEGLLHALQYERNLRHFVIGHALLVGVALVVGIHPFSVIFVTMAAGFFVIVELLNTALERVTDTFDDHLKTARGGHEHPGVKMAKDVGSAASLIALTMYGVTMVFLILPYVLSLVWFVR